MVRPYGSSVKYLQAQPFSGATSNGKMSAQEYFIAVGALVLCKDCGEYAAPKHTCHAQPPDFAPSPENEMCDCGGCC